MQINLGAQVCERLRIIYYKNKKWTECHKEVSKDFSRLKEIAKKFYTDLTEHEILVELNRYNDSDILDAMK